MKIKSTKIVTLELDGDESERLCCILAEFLAMRGRMTEHKDGHDTFADKIRDQLIDEGFR